MSAFALCSIMRERRRRWFGTRLVATGLEESGGSRTHLRRTIRSRAKMDPPLAFAAQVQFGEGGSVAPGEHRLRPPLPFEASQGQLDRLLGAQFVDAYSGQEKLSPGRRPRAATR